MTDWEPSLRYPDPHVEVVDPAFAKYRLPLASVERLYTGCRWSEGPVWFGDGRYFLWSDIPNNRFLRWEEETGAVSVFRSPSGFRRIMNVDPPWWGTGISIAHVAPDWKRMEVVMRRRPWNMNAFGTHFGGSLYSMCDPHYVLLLVPLLGRDYIIWDKSAAIEFLRPGKGTVRAVFEWSDAQLEEIRERTAGGEKFEPERSVDITDEAGEVVARVRKQLYVRRKRAT